MKKRLVLLITLLMFIFIPGVKAAGSATISITPSSSTVIVGNNITVKVTISANQPFAGYQYVVQADPTILSLVSSNSSSGSYMNADATPQGGSYSVSHTYTFKARQSGKVTISLTDEQVAGENLTYFSISKYTSSITVMTQAQLEATYSKNNNLSSLSIEGYTLTPSFNKNVTEYTVKLKPETETVNVVATKEDNTASVYGTGKINVSDGQNQIKVQVTAQNGNVKIYTINATVEELSPVEIKLNGATYSVIRKKKALEFDNNLFKMDTTTIQGNEVPCYINDITNTTVIGLKNQDGDVLFAVQEDDKYYLYREIKTGNISILYLDNENAPYNYIRKEVTIGNNIYNAYVKEETSRYYLLYGINLATGNRGFYSYDNLEDSLQRFDLEETKKQQIKDKETKKIELILGISAIFFFIVFIINLIISSIRNRKLKKKLKEVKNNYTSKKEEITKEEVIEEKKEIKNEEIKEEKIEETRIDDKESITQVIESLKQEEKKTKANKRKNVK